MNEGTPKHCLPNPKVNKSHETVHCKSYNGMFKRKTLKRVIGFIHNDPTYNYQCLIQI
jgi:hypothetical protein